MENMVVEEAWRSVDEAKVNSADLKMMYITKTSRQHLTILGNKESK